MKAALITLLTLVGACSGYASETGPSPTTATAPLVLGVPVADFYQATCAACHGTDRSGFSGPALLPKTLVENDAFYATTIRDGRPDLGMPGWGVPMGFTEADLSSLVSFLRTDPASSSLAGEENTTDIDGVGAIAAGPVEVGGSVHFTWNLTNRSGEPIDLVRFSSPSLSVFLVDALPVSLDSGQSVTLHGVFVPEADTAAGVAANGEAAIETSAGGLRRVTITATPAAPAHSLAFTEVGLPSQPVRLTTWGRFLYVGYLNGLIDVFGFTEAGTLERIEQIRAIADTLNHGPDGTPQPEQSGRLIGGFAIDESGTLFVTHGDPRLNEGEFVQTGHLADLNSGMLTALTGPPGEYGNEGHRLDLITGLPRNVTNHMPLGLAYRHGELFITVGGMTDAGAVDPSKPDPDTEISGAILRLDLEAGRGAYPIVLTEPGAEFADADDLVSGVLDLWATGVRNGFGLTFHQGDLYLTDQGSDGGAAPPPAEGVPGFGPSFGPDHLHRVFEGSFLGQPNQARNELVLNDGSAYVTHVASPGYSPPVHYFGIHNSATGIVTYHGALFPELEGQLLVGKFSGSLGAQALDIDGDQVTATVIAGLPTVRNITDVAVGPGGEIVLADFWGLRLLIATGWE
jgi:hypothetical protein